MGTIPKRHKTEAQLGKELSNLADQVVAAIKSAGVRNEVKGVGKEALRGLRATGGRLTKALNKAKDSDAAHNIRTQAQRVLEIGKSSGEKSTLNFRMNLSKGLHHLGEELQKLAKNLK